MRQTRPLTTIRLIILLSVLALGPSTALAQEEEPRPIVIQIEASGPEKLDGADIRVIGRDTRLWSELRVHGRDSSDAAVIRMHRGPSSHPEWIRMHRANEPTAIRVHRGTTLRPAGIKLHR